MLSKKSSVRVMFLNQTVGALFRELVEDSSKTFAPVILYSGSIPEHLYTDNTLTVIAAPTHNRSSNLTRLVSWLHYFATALLSVMSLRSRSLLFIVSNPPFLGLVGLFFKLLRKQKYVVLVYDIY